ncbi:MAG TPA: hypothetical protein VI997_00370 [Candidatus Thermoplasmatota archaeon]|nr:hypothetical protein [Candidatus Thermoplasmatota archaeon]
MGRGVDGWGDGPRVIGPLVGLVLLAILAPGTAAQSRIDAVVATPAEPGEFVERPLEMAFVDLASEHPAIARAVEDPDRVVFVLDEEQPSTAAFFDRMEGHDFLRTRGTDFRVTVDAWSDTSGDATLPEAPVPPLVAATALGAAALVAARGARTR